MIWMNPWAWLGVLGVVLPVLIHLLGRGHATPKKFPSLRFIDASRLLPTRRTRVHDPLLLLLRALIVLVAAAALAGPLLISADRRTLLDRGLARAIVVDTSASMLRLTASGRRAVDVARDSATRLAAAAQTSVIVESATPWTALPSAAAWIPAQGRRAEVVILSDFQSGALERDDLASIPSDAGVVLARIAVRDTTPATTNVVTWPAATTAPKEANDIAMIAGPDEAAQIAAMRDAVGSRGSIGHTHDSTQAVAIVFPRAVDRVSIMASAKPVSNGWMVAVLRRLADAHVSLDGFASASVGGRSSLVLLSSAEPGTLAATQLLATATAAENDERSALEGDPTTLSDDTLRSWSRAPSSSEPASQHRPVGENGPSDARWLWLAVLALLVLEMVVRRSRNAIANAVEVTARAA